jgi:peptidoglycan/LPS O-acetylase OafA/YrhL
MSSARVKPADHLAPLDGLRGLAVALVVWFHVWQITWLPADIHIFAATVNFNWIPEDGFIGVDLFFFISGFCLFYPYARTLFDGAPKQRVATFAYRRAIKILPSYVFAIAVMIALGWAKFDSPADALRQVTLHLLFIHTFFSDSYGSINGVLWSLATEVQFYAIFPFVCWAAMKRPWLTFFALFAIANAYRLFIAHDFDIVHQIDQLPGTLDLFGCGMFAAYLFRLVATRAPGLAARRALWTAVAIVSCVALYALVQALFAARLFPNWPMAWEIWGRPLMALLFASLTLGSLFAIPLWQRALANPALVFLSAISYNLYLWHQPVARALFDARLPKWTQTDEHYDAVWGLEYSLVAFVAGVVVATAVTYALERPLLHWRPLEPRFERAPKAPLDAASRAASLP